MTVIEGIVEHGDARGRTLGFPTANIALSDLEITDGVWVAQVRIGSETWAVAAVSVGRRRTFHAGEGPRLLEAHLLDFDGNLYGQTLRIELITQLRKQQSFSDIHALTEQLQRDVENTRQWALIHRPWLVSTQGFETRERALV